MACAVFYWETGAERKQIEGFTELDVQEMSTVFVFNLDAEKTSRTYDSLSINVVMA